jgi:predicted O-methyltransferase YrrM
MLKVTDLAHLLVSAVLKEGAIAVDATAGNGRDTLFLARLVGPGGRVYAFDLQEEALRRTAGVLDQENLRERVVLIHAGHQQMSDYVVEPVSAAVFNLGYLPGGDHNFATRADSTVAGLEAALNLLAPGGLAAMVVYPGHREGLAEKEALLAFCRKLNPSRYAVIFSEIINRITPPDLIAIQKY